MTSPKTLSWTPETYVSALHLWPMTSPPPLEVPRLPRLCGCRTPWKAFSSLCGPGHLEAGPRIRTSGCQNPKPTGSPDATRGSASAGPGRGSSMGILSSGGLFWKALSLPLWLVALLVLQSRSSPRDLCSLLLLPAPSPAPSPLSGGTTTPVSTSRKTAVCFCSSGPRRPTVSLSPE